MIVHLTSLNLLLFFFYARTTKADTMYDTLTELRNRNIEPLRIRNDIHSKCADVPTLQLIRTTSTQNPTTTKTIDHDCMDSLPLETTSQKQRYGLNNPTHSSMYTYFQREPSPPQDTLEDINLYCQFLERAFKLTQQPSLTIPKYNNQERLHFTDSPLLRSEPTSAPHIVTKPCKNDLNSRNENQYPIIKTPSCPRCPRFEHNHKQNPKINNLYNLLSFLSPPSVKPAFQNDCSNFEQSNLDEHPIKETIDESSNINQQNKMYNAFTLDNYANTDSKWNKSPPNIFMQYLNLLTKNLEFPLPIPRQRRSVRRSPFVDGHEDLNLADEVSERLPIEEFSINDRIIGGTVVHSKEVPYQVALYKLDYFICGSSLISKFYILTAGHCLDNIKASDLWIRVGSEHLLKGGKTYKVSDYTVHPEYNTTDFDIAIIRSASPITFSPAVMPIALPSFADADLPENLEVTGSGWGATERKRNKKATYTLHKIVLLTVDRESCRDRIMASRNTIGRRQICTNLPLKAGMCFGDSGGPLVANKKLVGIVSWGSPCAIGDADVYTNVQAFLPWIYCEVKKLNFKYSNN